MNSPSVLASPVAQDTAHAPHPARSAPSPAVPLPRFSRPAARAFELVFDRLTGALLAGVHLRLPADLAARLPADRPVLLVGNHVSNWDGFLFRALQKRLRPAAPLFSLMLAHELRRLPFFRLLGGLGVEPGSAPSNARSLRAARALRAARNDFFFTVFPQGSTYPATRRPLGFLPGVRAFAQALAPVTVLPVALRLEHAGSLRPHAYVNVGEPIATGPTTPASRDLPFVLEAAVTALLDETDALLCRAGESAPREFVGAPRAFVHGAGERSA